MLMCASGRSDTLEGKIGEYHRGYRKILTAEDPDATLTLCKLQVVSFPTCSTERVLRLRCFSKALERRFSITFHFSIYFGETCRVCVLEWHIGEANREAARQRAEARAAGWSWRGNLVGRASLRMTAGGVKTLPRGPIWQAQEGGSELLILTRDLVKTVDCRLLQLAIVREVSLVYTKSGKGEKRKSGESESANFVFKEEDGFNLISGFTK